jgi:hypothetical protein
MEAEILVEMGVELHGVSNSLPLGVGLARWYCYNWLGNEVI